MEKKLEKAIVCILTLGLMFSLNFNVYVNLVCMVCIAIVFVAIMNWIDENGNDENNLKKVV